MKILKYLVLSLFLVACHLDKKPDNPPVSPKNPPTPKATGENKTTEKAIKLLWSGTLEFTNTDRYKDFLRANRKCDPCTAYTGPYACNNFTSRADITIEFKKQELPAEATLTIKPYLNPDASTFTAYACLGGTGGFNTYNALTPITLEGTARPWREYEGFYVNFSGSRVSAATLRSESSTPEVNGVLNVTFYYGSARPESEVGKANLDNSDLEDDSYGGQGGR